MEQSYVSSSPCSGFCLRNAGIEKENARLFPWWGDYETRAASRPHPLPSVSLCRANDGYLSICAACVASHRHIHQKTTITLGAKPHCLTTRPLHKLQMSESTMAVGARLKTRDFPSLILGSVEDYSSKDSHFAEECRHNKGEKYAFKSLFH